jgi:hypothetical protein
MKQVFSAVIKQHQNIDGAYIEPPFDVEEVFGAKRVKVIATFDGVEYHGSIVRMGGCYMLGITKEIRTKIGKNFGDTVSVTIEKEEEERTIEIPADFTEVLKNNPEAMKTYDGLSYTGKRDYIRWITDAKKAETRLNRIEKSVQLLSEGKKLK